MYLSLAYGFFTQWKCESVSHSVMSNSLWHQGLQPTELLLSKEFSGQEYWNGLSFPSPGDLPDPGIEPRSSALQADSLPSKPKGYPNIARCWRLISHFCVPKEEEKERENEGILLDDSASFKWVLSQVFPVTPVYVSLFTPTRRRDEKM